MRKFYIPALTIISVILVTLATSCWGKKASIGIVGGYNSSTIALKYTKTYDFHNGYNIGAFGEYHLNSAPISFAIEAHYMEYGANDIDASLIYSPESFSSYSSLKKAKFFLKGSRYLRKIKKAEIKDKSVFDVSS